MSYKEIRVYHKGYYAVRNRHCHRVRIYDADHKMFYSCKMDNKANEQDLIGLIDALTSYRKRSELRE